jgi:DNA-binding FadR family transcriptional regulator
MAVHYNLREQLLNEIGRQIVSGALAPGDILPKEDALSESYAVSRTVVREAIKGLAARGLVESRPKTGTSVQPRSEWQLLDPEVLEWMAASEPDGRFLLRLAEVRAAIEPAAAALAARYASEADLARIAEAFAQLETAGNDEEAWAAADLQFHASIAAACHNELLTYIVGALRRPLHSRRRLTVSFLGILEPSDVTAPYTTLAEESLARHRAVLHAIQQRDSAAAYDAAYTLLQRVTEALAHNQ